MRCFVGRPHAPLDLMHVGRLHGPPAIQPHFMSVVGLFLIGETSLEPLLLIILLTSSQQPVSQPAQPPASMDR